MRLPTWMRVVMYATAVMNILGGIAFIPSAKALRELGGLPMLAHPLYVSTLGAFIIVFGFAYLWSGMRGTADRQFVAVAAAGKLSFFALLVRYWLGGVLPLAA